jgi:hypothetical protein
VPTIPGVYAFAIDDAVTYVGLSSSGLRRRIDQYRRGHKGQRTSARVKALIAEAVARGQEVKVWVPMPEPGEWRGLPVNVAAGLELGLIQKMRPVWNILGAAT